MIKKRIQKCTKFVAAAMMAAMCMMSVGGVTAYANVDQTAVEAAEAQAGENVIVPEQTPETEQPQEPVIDRQSFSVPGNGEVLDDISGDPTKEFYTIRTANNNTYYMVIDKSATSENVYMLSMIDEQDLKEFLNQEETEPAEVTPTPAVVLEENTQTEPQTEAVKPEENKPQNNYGSLAIIGVAALAGLGGYFFLKRKKKDDQFDVVSENLEYDDGLEVVNEDEESGR